MDQNSSALMLSNQDSSISFYKYKFIYTDSKESLFFILKKGVAPDVTFLTSSPAVHELNLKDYQIKYFCEFWSKKKMQAFQKSAQNFSEEIFANLKKLEFLSHEDKLNITREASVFNRVIYKLACLTSAHLNKSFLFVKLVNDSSNFDYINPLLDEILRGYPHFNVFNFNITPNKSSVSRKFYFFKRLKILGINEILYRLIVKIKSKIIFLPFLRKRVFIISENELINDIAIRLIYKGYDLVLLKQILKKEGLNSTSYSIERFEEIKLCIKKTLEKRISDWIFKDISENVLEYFYNQLHVSISRYESYKISLINPIRRSKVHNKSISLINSPVTEFGLAFAFCARNLKIPLITAEHGVTFEICETHGEYMYMHEANVGDLFLCFNPESKNVAHSSNFLKSEVKIVGASSRHNSLSKKTMVSNRNGIAYVSTNLYKGNINLFSAFVTDLDRLNEEKYLISEILAKIPHKVFYKTYPEKIRRYVDEDPAIEYAKKFKNIEVIQEDIDMRYLIADFRIFITTKATSTLSWIIFSRKPLIFINKEHNMPLTSEAYSSLEKSIFLFNYNDKNFKHELTKFLSKPIDEIENLWKMKSAHRKKMIRRFFSEFESDPGKRTADIIEQSFFHN